MSAGPNKKWARSNKTILKAWERGSKDDKLKTIFRFSKTEKQSKMQPNSHSLITCYNSTYNHYNFKYIDSLDTYIYTYNLDVY